MAIMAVLTNNSLVKPEAETRESEVKTPTKSMEKFRPITATLKHPLILDVKLLRKLDMTTFTKKGLMALSKFCGISLVTRKRAKRKSKNRSSETSQISKKQLGKENNRGGGKGRKESSAAFVSSSDSLNLKRKPTKAKILRFKPRIILLEMKKKEEEDDGDGEEEEEDSSDVICKKHDKSTEGLPGRGPMSQKPRFEKEINSSIKKIDLIDAVSDGVLEVVPEPCRSCSRRHQPERLHSHPKSSVKMMDCEKRKPIEKKSAEERLKNSLRINDVPDLGNSKKIMEKSNSRRRGPSSAKDIESPQKLPLSDGEMNRSSSSVKTVKPRGKSDPQIQLTRTSERKWSPEVKFDKKSSVSSQSIGPQTTVSPGIRSPAIVSPAIGSSSKLALVKKSENKKSPTPSPVEDRMKYITGCYVCGRQISAKARTNHEKECIVEWRSRNELLDPKNRKPEPIRPDYRFTASGDLDCEATFESIWANHVDSLVPCRKCGRKFFPDRIERHENCCKNSVWRIKHKH